MSPANSSNHVVGLGASAGGLDAIQTFFQNLPLDMQCAFIVLQHQPVQSRSLLTELLRHHCPLPVQEACNGMPADPGVVIVVPPAKDLHFVDGRIALTPAPEDFAWYPIDRMFESLAESFGDNALAIILSGTGSDGTLGARALKEKGATIFVQEPASAGFDGMPAAAINAGLADVIDRPRELARHLVNICRSHRTKAVEDSTRLTSQQRHQVLSALRVTSQIDFSPFKERLIDLRVFRRMRFNQIADPAEYLQHLSLTPAEQQLLSRELLLRPSGFFRNRELFQQLSSHFAERLSQQPADQPYRVWIPGCGTGEEAISFAIVVHEVIAELDCPVSLQIFASDLDENSLQIARKGLYPYSVAANIDASRLEKYFDRTEDGWRVSRDIRNRIVFARHDISIDPPYTRLDFIGCRELLSYMKPQIQLSVFERLLYTLRPDGEVLLGVSGHIDVTTMGYEVVPSIPGLYRKKPDMDPVKGGFIPISRRRSAAPSTGPQAVPIQRDTRLVNEFLLEEVLAANNCAAFITDGDGLVQAAYGELDLYLHRLPQGQSRLQELLRTELRSALETVLDGAANDQRGTEVDDILIELERAPRLATISARNVQQGGPLHDLFTVVVSSTGLSTSAGDADEPQARVRELEQEVLRTRADQRTAEHQQIGLQEQLQTTQAELRDAANELIDLSQRLDERSAQLHDVSMDFINLRRESGNGVLVMDTELTLLRYTPPFDRLFELTPQSLGAPMPSVLPPRFATSLEPELHRCLDTLASGSITLRLQEVDYGIRITPFRREDNAVRGVMLIARPRRSRQEHDDARIYTPVLLAAHEALLQEASPDASICAALEQLMSYDPISFAAYTNGSQVLIRPTSVTLDTALFSACADNERAEIHFFDQRDMQSLVDGSAANWAALFVPPNSGGDTGLVVGSARAEIFDDAFLQHLAAFSLRLAPRSGE